MLLPLLILALGLSPLPVEAASSLTAIEKSLSQGKTLFLLFYDVKNEETLAMKKPFEEVVKEHKNEACLIEMKTKDICIPKLAKQFSCPLEHMSPPFALIAAPNGALVGIVVDEPSKQHLEQALALSPAMQQFFKAIQEQKTILLCLQNDADEESFAGSKELSSDSAFAESVCHIVCSGSDPQMLQLLSSLGVETLSLHAHTLVIRFPGAVLSHHVGSVSKEQLICDLNAQKAPAGCL